MRYIFIANILIRLLDIAGLNLIWLQVFFFSLLCMKIHAKNTSWIWIVSLIMAFCYMKLPTTTTCSVNVLITSFFLCSYSTSLRNVNPFLLFEHIQVCLEQLLLYFKPARPAGKVSQGLATKNEKILVYRKRKPIEASMRRVHQVELATCRYLPFPDCMTQWKIGDRLLFSASGK